MNKIKNRFLIIIAMICCFAFTLQAVHASEVTTVNATLSNGVITVSGTTDSSVVSAAIWVYAQGGTEPVAMGTTAVTGGTYSYKFNDRKLTGDTYVVRVADYKGGDYKSVTVKKSDDDYVAPDTSVK